MEAAVVLFTLVCYGSAYVVWWRYESPLFFFALLSGHIGALASPLWMPLYGVVYRSDLAVVQVLFSQPLFRAVLIASAWFYTLPALAGLVLCRMRWWSSGYATSLIAYGIFLFYHLAVEMLGLQFNVWSYSTIGALPLGVPHALVSAVMGALISLVLLYVLLVINHFAWPSVLIVLLPATLMSSLIVHGVLGAPLWIARVLSTQELLATQNWAVSVGLISTILLLIWAIHIISRGLQRADQRLYSEA